MNIPNDAIKYLIDVFILIAGGFIAYVVKGQKEAVTEAKDMAREAHIEAEACKLGIAEHRAHVSETYCDKVSMQSTLERIHNRIDVIGEDIKTLLAKGKK